jgi:hypothetical protein
MEILNAVVESDDDKYFIKIKTEGDEIRIPISEEDQNEVKRAFNLILNRIKNGVFEIKLQYDEEDLFNSVAKEYLQQLNQEIIEIHGIMESNGLLS